MKDLSREAMRVLLEYGWPGNVRELKSAIDFATLHCKKSVINVEDLPSEMLHTNYSQPMPATDTHQDERQRVLAALEAVGGNRTLAAQKLGMSRATLYRRMTSLGIETVKPSSFSSL